jgi:hypothetical protein
LSRLASSFVLGFHGCDRSVAEKILAGEEVFLQSDKAYDWLGPGAYFWESDQHRAREFAQEQRERGKYQNPVVIGAVIDLGNCLNLSSREGVLEVAASFQSYEKLMTASGKSLPVNENSKTDNVDDRLLRYLDCAVIRHLHSIIEAQPLVAPYDTVRGMFTEGKQAYPGAKIYEKSHVQIAVRNSECIRGVFRPRLNSDKPTG